MSDTTPMCQTLINVFTVISIKSIWGNTSVSESSPLCRPVFGVLRFRQRGNPSILKSPKGKSPLFLSFEPSPSSATSTTALRGSSKFVKI